MFLGKEGRVGGEVGVVSCCGSGGGEERLVRNRGRGVATGGGSARGAKWWGGNCSEEVRVLLSGIFCMMRRIQSGRSIRGGFRAQWVG